MVNNMVNLTDKFYELIDMGYIYEEDENGHNMSYGEYAAISDWLIDSALECLNGYDFIEDLESMHDTLESADDDTRMFMGDWFFEEFYDFYDDFNFDEYEGTFDCGRKEVPHYLEEVFETFKCNYENVA